MRKTLKQLALAVATVLVAPSLLVFQLKKALMGRDRAIEGSTQTLSLIPGVAGDFLRRAFLRYTLDHFNVPAKEKGEVLAGFFTHKHEVTTGYRAGVAARP